MKTSPYRFPYWILFLSIFLGSFSLVCSQEGLHIQGRVLSGDQGKPLAYATIQVCGEAYGALSNKQGEFNAYLPPRFAKDTLCISIMGYQTLKRPISTFLPNEISSFFLVPNSALGESSDLYKDRRETSFLKKVVKQAVRKIPQNFPLNPFVLSGYYREYIRQDTGYLNLFEAAISVWDPGFQTQVFSDTHCRILQTRFREEIDLDMTLAGAYYEHSKDIPFYQLPSYGGNEFSILHAHNPIRNYKTTSFAHVNRLAHDFPKNHIFSYDTLLVQEDGPLFQISFVLNKDRVASKFPILQNAPNEIVSGKIWIHSGSYGIKRFEYQNYFENNPRKLRYEVIVEYQEVQEKLYLKYISMNNYFEMEDRTKTAFKVVEVSLLKGQDKIVLYFNRKPVEPSLTNPHFFKVFYQGSELNIKNCEPLAHDAIILTVPGIEQLLVSNPMVKGPFVEEQDLVRLLDSKQVSFTISSLVRDLNEVSYGKYPPKGMYQFREWFINDVKTTAIEASADKMDKMSPLHQQRKENDPNFWDYFTVMVNAPLKEP